MMPIHNTSAPQDLVDACETLLKSVDPEGAREGTKETPVRFAKAWTHWTSGYHENPAEVLKVFGDGGNTYTNMVVIDGIPVNSMCEHHLAPIFGEATVAYIPNGRRQKIIGLSKASRLVGIFARRLQVQERLTTQIAETMHKELEPVGVAVQLRCRHMCMESRGVQQRGVVTTTTATHGELEFDPVLRGEFMQQCGKQHNI